MVVLYSLFLMLLFHHLEGDPMRINVRNIVIAFLISNLLYTGVVMADESKNAEKVQALKDEVELLLQETKRLETEKTRLEAEQKLAEAKAGPSADAQEIERLKERIELLTEQKNLVNAYAPSFPPGLEGKITLDSNQSIEATAVAYRTMRSLVPSIIERLKTHLDGDTRIVLLTDIDKNALAAWELFSADLELLKNAYNKHIPKEEIAPVALLAGAGTIAKTASDLMALFRTDTEFKARTVTIPDESLIAEFANAFDDRVVYYSAGYPAWAGKTTPVVELLTPLNAARQEARARHQDRFDLLDKQAAEAKTDEDKSAIKVARTRTENQWADLEGAFTAFTKSLRERDTTTGATPLGQIARGYWLHDQFGESGKRTVGLSLKVLHAGGTYVLKKTFWNGTTMRQSGGIVIEYFLFDNTGRVLTSGTADEVREFPDLTIQQ